LAPALGITAITGAVSMVVATMVVGTTGGVISITTAVSEGAKASSIVVSTVVASGAVIVASMAMAEDSTVAAGSMEVAVATEADTGKISSSWSKDRDGWQHPTASRFVFMSLEYGNSVS